MIALLSQPIVQLRSTSLRIIIVEINIIAGEPYPPSQEAGCTVMNS